jgi:peptide/nickel transport system permease protein
MNVDSQTKGTASTAILAVLVLVFLAGPLLAPQDPIEQHREIANTGPSVQHWLGADEYGRDILSRFLAGGSWSILAGMSGTMLVLVLGWSLGGIAGFKGGWLDQVFMRLGEFLLSLPWLYALIGLRAVLPLDMKPRTAVAVMLLFIALLSWARPARLVRGMVLSLSERGYVESARGFGVPEWRIFLRHILPPTLGVLGAQALVLFPRFVLAEVTLSFLGLGVGEPEPSWGALILSVKQAYLLREQWWRFLPICLMLPLFVSCAVSAHSLARSYRPAR